MLITGRAIYVNLPRNPRGVSKPGFSETLRAGEIAKALAIILYYFSSNVFQPRNVTLSMSFKSSFVQTKRVVASPAVSLQHKTLFLDDTQTHILLQAIKNNHAGVDFGRLLMLSWDIDHRTLNRNQILLASHGTLVVFRYRLLS